MYARWSHGCKWSGFSAKKGYLFAYSNTAFQVRGTTGVTAGVAGINAAASFDKKAIRQRGEYLGEEFRGKGANVYLGPDVNLVRSPYAGRNFETFGEDPFLSGVAGVETILGVQSKGVVSNNNNVSPILKCRSYRLLK